MKKIMIVLAIFMFSLNIWASVIGTTLEGYIFARNKDQMIRLVGYVRNGDKESFLKYVKELQVTGEGGALDDGLKVEIINNDLGLVEIRLVGRTETVWTVTEAIKKD